MPSRFSRRDSAGRPSHVKSRETTSEDGPLAPWLLRKDGSRSLTYRAGCRRRVAPDRDLVTSFSLLRKRYNVLSFLYYRTRALVEGQGDLGMVLVVLQRERIGAEVCQTFDGGVEAESRKGVRRARDLLFQGLDVVFVDVRDA